MIEVDDAVLSEIIEEWMADYVEEIVDKLDNIGMQCVNIARERGNYTDRTGNLRNSIASAVVVDGKVARSNLFMGEGKAQAHQYIQELAQENNEGIVLLLVAGMNYAAYVEFGHSDGSRRSYDVIVSAEGEAEKLVDELLNQIENEGITTD